MFATAFLSMSLLTVNPEMVDRANDLARSQLIQSGVSSANQMTDTELQIAFLTMKSAIEGKESFKFFLDSFIEIVKKSSVEEGESYEVVHEVIEQLTNIVEYGLTEMTPHLIELMRKTLTDEEITLLFAISLDKTSQNAQTKTNQFAKEYASKFVEIIQTRMEELFNKLDLEDEDD